MRQSRFFAKTLREDPADSDTASHRLMVRAALIDQLAAGLYTMLPLGLRAQRKLEAIVRDEMDATGALEVQMPVLQPAEIWQQSGRNVAFAEVLFRLADKRDRPHVLGPTHEEVVTRLVAQRARSHRDLPVTLYQMHTKHRDELRPRAGLLRVREFIMKDAYSFDATEEGLDASYEAMASAYGRIFERCGLDVAPVHADSGAIGGKESVEYVLPCDAGEDTVVRCGGCDYAANAERAVFARGAASDEAPLPLEEVSTPGVKTIEALARFLDIEERQTVKAVFYTALTGEAIELIFVAIRGDVPVNEVKLKNYVKADALRLTSDDEVRAAGLVAGSASPVGLSGIRTIADLSVPLVANAAAGANRSDVHLKNVNFGRDFHTDEVVDIGTARAGDTCARCGGTLRTERGMELGHIFKLGTRYTDAFGAAYLDDQGRERPIWMGCYGIGIGRTLAAIVEAHHDARGVTWPAAVAPYDVHLVALNLDNADVKSAADRLYAEMTDAQIAVLFDDRAESPGVKFNDADLFGLPTRITIGPRGLRDGLAELRDRKTGETRQLPLDGVVEAVR